MKIVIRTDSSAIIGSGHLMRCLTLADRLRCLGASIVFICRRQPGPVYDEVERQGFRLYRLDYGYDNSNVDGDLDLKATLEIVDNEKPVDWLIVDHYELDHQWESGIDKKVGHLMAIDDPPGRPHNCDLFLDQNLSDENPARYDSLVPGHCQNLIGPEYALLREEFSQLGSNLAPREGSIGKLLISMGGADPENITEKAIEGLSSLNRSDILIDVVIGPANPHAERIRNLCRALPSCRIHHPAQDMAQLMAAADLALGAGGSTTWERCCLGLPTLFIASSGSEARIAKSVEKAGAGRYLGLHHEVTPKMIAENLNILMNQPELIRRWSKKAFSLVDGVGADRVSRAILKYAVAEVRS